MSILLAKEIVERLGAGRVVHLGAEDEALARELRLAGCDATAADPLSLDPIAEGCETLILDLPPVAPRAALALALVQAGSAANLVLRAPGEARADLEQAIFEAGWRRHPAGMKLWEYQGLDDRRLAPVSYYQRIPAEAARRWTIADLLPDRGLHMDMLRESGSRADAHIVRYVLAADYIRPGDRVLDCACGLGYGTAVLAALSRGSDFVGVDLDPDTAAYAQANYGLPGLNYQAGDAGLLADIPDASIDVVVSMETLEHVPDWEAALAAFQRVLKPDGRLVTSVPDRWMDETGEDPNPHHLHVFDWAKLADGLAQRFIVEAKYVQAAPGGFKLPEAGRELRRTDLEADDDTEWLLAVAAANPFDMRGMAARDFRHPQFAGEAAPPVVADFGAAYDNPYLYRPLVQMGERITDDDKLVRLALLVAENARRDSADRGGAVAVLGYRVLEARNVDAARDVLAMIDDFAEASAGGNEPHVRRWRLSLAFLAARLCEMIGDPAAARAWYGRTLDQDWRAFSPLLATKTVAAAFFQGRLALRDGDEAGARQAFQRGVAEALDAARADPRDIVGEDPEKPLPFGLQELAEVVDMGSQCAAALSHLHLWRRSPGVFWKQIDTRRFGLAGWAKDLEQENARLRRAG